MTKGNHCVRAIYYLPSLNGDINFKPFEHLILTHLHLIPKPSNDSNPKANKKNLIFTLCISCELGLLIYIIINVMQAFNLTLIG